MSAEEIRDARRLGEPHPPGCYCRGCARDEVLGEDR